MSNNSGMVDVSGKNVTVRIAKARGTINLGDDAFGVLKSGGCNKGDVLATAKIAAVQAVKQTQTLIPLCHSLLIEAVTVEFYGGFLQKCPLCWKCVQQAIRVHHRQADESGETKATAGK